MPNDVDGARQIYGAVLRALDAAARWQNQEIAQAESEYAQTIQSAETARKQAEEAAAQMRAKGTKQANELSTLIEDAVKRGENLYTHADLGKNRPQISASPRSIFSALPPNQALQRLADQATSGCRDLQTQLAELEQARRDNSLQVRRLITVGAILVAVALVVIVVMALRS